MPDSESFMRYALKKLLTACAWTGQALTRLWHAVTPVPHEQSRRTYPTCFQAEVPCQGDAFDFRVTIHELWTRPGESEALELAVSERIKAQHMVLERQLRNISRRFQPEAAADFERAANAEIRSARFPGDLALDCSYSVHAAPDEEFHQHLRNAEIKRIEAHAEHARKEQHLDHLELMRKRWVAFLGQFDGDPLGSLAAQLVGDPRLADAIEKRTSEQERHKDELRKLCDTATEAYRDKDVFDFVSSTDSALSRLLRHLGIEAASGPGGGPATGGSDATNGVEVPGR